MLSETFEFISKLISPTFFMPFYASHFLQLNDSGAIHWIMGKMGLGLNYSQPLHLSLRLELIYCLVEK